jgi:TRAP-type C4-dicarboxylate transport system substrate-binding protein
MTKAIISVDNEQKRSEKMKKKGMFIGVIALMVVGLVMGIAGCRPAAPPPEKETYELLYHCPWPPGIILSDIEIWYLDEVEERSEGRITFDRVFGGTLGTLFAQSENITGDVFDVGQTSYVYTPGLYPLGTVTTLPAIEADSVIWGRSCHELMEEQELIDEYTALDQKYLFTWALEPMELYSYEPIDSLDDLLGLRIRVHGGSALAGEKLGWTGVTVPWEEIAVASAERVVDAACVPVYITGRDAGLHTIYPYYISDFPIYQFHFATVCNLDAFNELPADLQQIMLDVGDDAVEYAFDYLAEAAEQGLQDLEDAGVETLPLPPEEWDKFVEQAGEPVWEDWVDEKTAAGLPAQEVLDKFQAILAEHH